MTAIDRQAESQTCRLRSTACAHSPMRRAPSPQDFLGSGLLLAGTAGQATSGRQQSRRTSPCTREVSLGTKGPTTWQRIFARCRRTHPTGTCSCDCARGRENTGRAGAGVVIAAANDNRVPVIDAWIAYWRVALDLDPNPDLDRDLASIMTTPVRVPRRARAPP